MIRRTNSSTSVISPRRAPSVTPSQRSIERRVSALSNAEQGHDAHATTAEDAIHEEIDEIKRYEDFTTIDWVQDAAREQLRKRARRQERAGFFEREGAIGWKRKIWEAFDAAQGWVIVTIIGVIIGFNAAFLNIATEWLSDIKLGYCTTAFYLNENFCCWGSESGCAEWHRWSGSLSPMNYVLYITFAGIFAFTSARLVKAFAPYAAGSGISEIKCIIAGFVMKGFLGFWTLFIKSVGLPLAIASGLSVGKEGPSVHYAVCAGNVVSRLFDKYKRSASKTREILSACAAAGVAVAFGSPIGGVLFSLEEMSNYFPLKTLWRSYFCALVATAVLAAMNPFRTGQLVMFQVRYDRSWHFFEILFYIVIGIFGGLYGAFMIKWNLRAQAFRKKYLSRYAILEATTLALFTAIICYPNMFLRIDMTESMEILFRECEGGYDYDHICEPKNRWSLVFSLATATVVRIFLVIISYGCKVPAGIFVPSMAIGASFGRMVGILVQGIQEAYPNSGLFAACDPDGPCITPGTYAFLGAGAALSGIMQITVSVVVIMFELTGALTYILPTMIVVGVTKAVSSRFTRGGIADRMIWFNGFPFLDNKEDPSFGVPVRKAMTPLSQVTVLPAIGTPLDQIDRLLSDSSFQGFPIVEDLKEHVLIGYIGRTELKYAVDRARRDTFIPREAICSFVADAAGTTRGRNISFGSVPTSAINPLTPGPSPHSSVVTVDPIHPPTSHTNLTPTTPAFHNQKHHRNNSFLSPITPSNAHAVPPPVLDLHRFPSFTPLTVSPAMPLETAMALFKKLGPRVILVEHQGVLTGLVTVKDCLKYQFKHEADVHREGEEDQGGVVAEREEKLWWLIKYAALWINGKVEGWSKGRIVLGEPDDTGGSAARARGISVAWNENPVERGHASDEVDELGRVTSRGRDVELEDRFPGGGTGSS